VVMCGFVCCIDTSKSRNERTFEICYILFPKAGIRYWVLVLSQNCLFGKHEETILEYRSSTVVPVVSTRRVTILP